MKFIATALTALVLAAPSMVSAAEIGNGRGWTGFYVGGHIGGIRSEFDGRFESDEPDPDEVAYFDRVDGTGFFSGGQIGFDYQVGRIVVGVVGDASKVSVNGADYSLAGAPADDGAGFGVDYLASARVRAGYPVADIMPYVTVGVAFAQFEGFVNNAGNPRLDLGSNEIGFAAGFGIDWAVTQSITVGVEAMVYQFDYSVDIGASGFPDADPGDFFEVDRLMQVRLMANYRF